ETGARRAGRRVRARLRGPAGPGDPAEGPDGAGLCAQDGRLGRRRAGRHLPDSGGQGDGGDGRPLQRRPRRHQEGGRAGAAAPHQHQLPGAGRGQDQRGRDRGTAQGDRRPGRAQIWGAQEMTERWYRVFGGSDVEPAPAALLEHLHGLGLKVACRFYGDDQGWSRAELLLQDGTILELARYLTDEDGIRAELNTWAAWVESVAEGPDVARLMQRLI